MLRPTYIASFLSTKSIVAQLVLITFASSNLFAQPQVVCKPAPVKGRVVGPAGKPVAGAKVVVRNDPYCNDIEWKATQPEKDDVLGEATTDDEGNFTIDWKVREISTIENTHVGAELLVFAPGFAIQFRTFSMWYSQKFEIKLVDEVEHRGMVIDDQGRPVADAEVLLDCIYKDPTVITHMSSNTSVTCLFHSTLRPRVRTDKEGVYRLRGLASKQIVLLQVRHPNFRSIRSLQPVDEASPKDIEPGQAGNPFGEWHNHYGQPIRMPSEKRVTMTAIDSATNQPIQGLEVCSFFSGESTFTDKHGKFEYFPITMKDLQRAQYDANAIYVRRPGESAWIEAYSRESGKVGATQLEVPRHRTISGKVVDEQSGAGVEGIAVYIGRSESPGFSSTLTNQDGEFTFTTFVFGWNVALSGPKLGYGLPVRKQSNSDPEVKQQPEIHRKNFAFKQDQDHLELNFALQRYPKVRVQIVNSAGKPVPKTIANMSANKGWGIPIYAAESNENGIVEFDIDRPIIHSTIWVANADGIGLLAVDGMPDAMLNLKLEPTIPIKGHLTLQDREGHLRDASDLPIYGEPADSAAWAPIRLAQTDKSGDYIVYFPKSEGNSVNLYVERLNDISRQSWKVELTEDADGDFTVLE